MLTNYTLSKKLGFTHYKIRRWSNELIPNKNRESAKQSGRTRVYSNKEALLLGIYGNLISELKYSSSEAKQIIRQLENWRKTKKKQIKDYEIIINRKENIFNIQAIIRREKKQLDVKSNTFEELYIQESITCNIKDENDIMDTRILYINKIYKKVMEKSTISK